MDLDSYLSSRSELLSQERSLRRDFTYLANLNPKEKEAEALVRRIRAEEATSIWNNDHEDIPHVFPGMEFLTAKSVIEKTRLFKILRKGGGLLHVHLDATVNTSFLLELALAQPAIHVRAATQLSSDTLTQYLPEFCPLAVSEYGKSTDMASSLYIPGTWVPLGEARRKFSLGQQVFDKWVLGALTINPTEAYNTHNTVTKIWGKFKSIFLVSQGIIRFAPIWERYIQEFFLSSVDDGIMYIEARINFLHRFMFGADGHENIPHEQWVEMFARAITITKKELVAQGRGEAFAGARIIYCTIRSITPDELEWYLDDCIKLKQKYPDFIAGFDLVGDENALRPLKYYLEPLLRFKQRQRALGIDIPFIFHAGETLGDGNHVDENLFDAVLGLKESVMGSTTFHRITSRILAPPYGLSRFSFVKHPVLMQLCRENGIALEVCPISNEILRLTSSMPTHPLPILFNNGIAVALSSDDPAIFGNLGLSFDYFQVLASSEVSGLVTLAVAARDSIKFSTLEDSEKKRVLELWENQWTIFVQNILAEFGSQ